MSAERAVERDGNWVLPITGCEVTQCCVDYAFSLTLMKPGVDAHLRIERPFSFERSSQKAVMLEPGKEWDELGPALGLFGLTVERGMAYADGRREIRFHDGSGLVVHPDVEGYEAWELSVDAGFQLVSMPGGGLAVWRERDSAR